MSQGELDLTATRATVRATLTMLLARDHRGRDNGIHAAELARRVGIVPRELRKLVSLMREDGEPIAATPETGYFIAETPDEIAVCCAFLRQRAMHSLRLEAQMKRISLADLMGQLHLNT